MSNAIEEFIDLDEFINNSNVKVIAEPNENNKSESIPFEQLYQIQGMKDKQGAFIKFIGQNSVRPLILILEFTFKKYECQIVSYILSNIDIKVVNDECGLKMLGLLIKYKDQVVAVITMSFFTFMHKWEGKDIMDFISYDNNILLSGFYAFDLKYYDKDIKKTEKIGSIFELFPGKTKSLYELINLLSDEKLSFLY